MMCMLPWRILQLLFTLHHHRMSTAAIRLEISIFLLMSTVPKMWLPFVKLGASRSWLLRVRAVLFPPANQWSMLMKALHIRLKPLTCIPNPRYEAQSQCPTKPGWQYQCLHFQCQWLTATSGSFFSRLDWMRKGRSRCKWWRRSYYLHHSSFSNLWPWW